MQNRKDPCEIIYDAIYDDERASVINHKMPARRIRASEIADCPRKIWYRLSGFVPLPRSAYLELTAQAGNIYHDYVRNLLLFYGVPLEGVSESASGSITENDNKEETRVVDGVETTLVARSDGWIGDAALEIKTAGLYKFKWMNEAFEKGGNAGALEYIQRKYPGYIWQGEASAHLNRKSKVYLLVVNRDNMQLGFYNPKTHERAGLTWDVEPAKVEAIWRKAAAVTKAVASGEAPPQAYNDGSDECKYCPFYNYCHGASNRRRDGQQPVVVHPIPEVQAKLA